jgi:predicted acetyltransferase
LIVFVVCSSAFPVPSLLPNWFAKPRRFCFQKPGELRDEELELVPPSLELVDSVVAVVGHSATRLQAPDLAKITRRQLLDSLALCPNGLQEGEASSGQYPTYHFWMRNLQMPELPMSGAIALRIGNSRELELYYGHVGYHVYPPHRGRHFAERSVRLLMPLAAGHGLEHLWITCNPENWASRRTCQRLGAILTRTTPIPPGHPLYSIGEIAKCCYQLEIPKGEPAAKSTN